MHGIAACMISPIQLKILTWYMAPLCFGRRFRRTRGRWRGRFGGRLRGSLHDEPLDQQARGQAI